MIVHLQNEKKNWRWGSEPKDFRSKKTMHEKQVCEEKQPASERDTPNQACFILPNFSNHWWQRMVTEEETGSSLIFSTNRWCDFNVEIFVTKMRSSLPPSPSRKMHVHSTAFLGRTLLFGNSGGVRPVPEGWELVHRLTYAIIHLAFRLSGGLPFIDPLSHCLLNFSPWMTPVGDPDSTSQNKRKQKATSLKRRRYFTLLI